MAVALRSRTQLVSASACCVAALSLFYGALHIRRRWRRQHIAVEQLHTLQRQEEEGSEAHNAMNKTGEKCALRLLCVNDVYSIEALAKLKPFLPQYTCGNSLLTLNGDFLGGFPLAVKTKGKAMIDAMNECGFDTVVLGNHEFDYGREVLEQRIKESNFQWLGANVVDKDTKMLLNGVHDVVIKQLTLPTSTKVNIGFFGVCTQNTPVLSYPGPSVEFLDVCESATQCVKKLKKQGADFIVGLTHVSNAQDRLIASKVEGIDIVLGGHDHTPLATTVDDTLIFKCGMNSEWLGVVDLEIIEDNGKLSLSPSWAMVDVRHSKELDEGVLSVIDNYANNDEASKEVLGCVVKRPLTSTTAIARSRGCTLGYLVADALQAHHDADLGLINGGFMRADKEYPVGHKLTLADVLNELPFPRECVRLDIKGEGLLLALEQHLSYLPAHSGAFIHVSKSWELKYNPKRAKGQRIISLTRSGEPVDPFATYSIALTSFMARGGDNCTGYTTGTRSSVEGSEVVVSSAVVAYLRNQPDDLEPEQTNRMLVVDE